MKILVTGGAGFIGSHVVDAYIKAGHSVAVIDNLATGFAENVNKKARFYRADIRDFKKIETIFKKERPGVVNHHAALAAVTASTKNPAETYEVNVMGTLNVLLASHGISRFIFASTGGALYCQPEKFPVSENEIPDPLSPYGFSKLLGEEMIRFYAQAHQFPFVILRYANVFGPRQNPHGEAGIVAIFSKLLAEDKTPTIYNKNATRDYVYVSDIVAANLLALHKGDQATLHIGQGEEITNQTVFESVAAEYLWRRGKPIYKPARPGELRRSALDASKARKILGWKPTISLEDGIRRIHDSQI